MSPSILVVDDEPDVAELFRQRSDARFVREPMSCISPPRAQRRWIASLEKIQPQLVAVLSDINMPEMDGLELLAEIEQRFPDLPVMMVTAYGDDERRRVAAAKGAAEFLTKPVDFDLLKAQLRGLPTAAD